MSYVACRKVITNPEGFSGGEVVEPGSTVYDPDGFGYEYRYATRATEGASTGKVIVRQFGCAHESERYANHFGLMVKRVP